MVAAHDLSLTDESVLNIDAEERAPVKGIYTLRSFSFSFIQLFVALEKLVQ